MHVEISNKMRDTLFPILTCIVFAVVFFQMGRMTAPECPTLVHGFLPFPEQAPAALWDCKIILGLRDQSGNGNHLRCEQ